MATTSVGKSADAAGKSACATKIVAALVGQSHCLPTLRREQAAFGENLLSLGRRKKLQKPARRIRLRAGFQYSARLPDRRMPFLRQQDPAALQQSPGRDDSFGVAAFRKLKCLRHILSVDQFRLDGFPQPRLS